MINESHPMLDLFRPLIATPPMDALGEAILSAVEMGHHGLLLEGDGRVGKTEGTALLSQRTEWRKNQVPMVFFGFCYTTPNKASECYFYNNWLHAADLKAVSNTQGNEGLYRIRNHLVSLANHANAQLIVCPADEAQRYGDREFNYLIDLDNQLHLKKKRLFMVLINQRDADKDGTQEINRRQPSQIKGRFLMSTHIYTGLIGWEHIETALSQYDEHMFWPPGSGISYTRHFAPEAFNSGWRFASHSQMIFEEIELLRAQNGLHPDGPWPMKTFDFFVYYMLVRIAGENRHFKEFTRENVRNALTLSGYVALEKSRFSEPV